MKRKRHIDSRIRQAEFSGDTQEDALQAALLWLKEEISAGTNPFVSAVNVRWAEKVNDKGEPVGEYEVIDVFYEKDEGAKA